MQPREVQFAIFGVYHDTSLQILKVLPERKWHKTGVATAQGRDITKYINRICELCLL
jgi:hypothetical protein